MLCLGLVAACDSGRTGSSVTTALATTSTSSTYGSGSPRQTAGPAVTTSAEVPEGPTAAAAGADAGSTAGIDVGSAGIGTGAHTGATAGTDAGAEDGAEAAPLPDGIITALLVGNDSRDGDLSGRSDVIVVVQLSEDRDHLHLVSIARDTSVDIPGHGRDKINEAYARGGVPLLRETVSGLLGGLEIDLVAQTNFEMFIALTRWLDGFWVDNVHASTVTIESTGRQVVFEEGRIFLENTDGLIYVRERKSLPLGDLDRTERHRAAVIGMMERLVEIREHQPEKLPELLPMLYQNVTVVGDLRPEQLMAMVELGAQLEPDSITSVMVPVSAFGWSRSGASVNILDVDQTAALADGLREGDLSRYVERYGTSSTPTGS